MYESAQMIHITNIVKHDDDDVARPLLQKLTIACGLLLMNDSSNDVNTHLLVDIAPIDTKQSDSPLVQQHNTFIFEQLISHAGTAWAACLLQPTLGICFV